MRRWTNRCSQLEQGELDTIYQNEFDKIQLGARKITSNWFQIESKALARGDKIQHQVTAAQNRIAKEEAEIAEQKRINPCLLPFCNCPRAVYVIGWPVSV